MMNCLILITSHLGINQGSGLSKLIVMISAVVILLVALWICVKITNKNKLYIKPNKEERNIILVKDSEVA